MIVTPLTKSTSASTAGDRRVSGAYAFWSHAKDEEPTIIVAVSNTRFRADAFDAFYDPRPVIDNDFVDDETAVIYYQFAPNGNFRGISYYLGSGDGCGFCSDSDAKSTVKISGSRAKGALSLKGENHSYNVNIDVTVAPKEWGKPVKGDAGDIGTAFRAYNSAIDAQDRKAMYDLVDAETQERWKKREKEGKLDGCLKYRQQKTHLDLKDAKIVGGYARDAQAVPLVKGTSPSLGDVHGQVALSKENGRWKIADKLYQTGQ